MTWTYVTDVESDSKPGTYYALKRRDDGVIGCACVAWRFNKQTPRTCKHIDAWRAAQSTVSFTYAPPVDRIAVGTEVFRFRRAISFGPIQANQ